MARLFLSVWLAGFAVQTTDILTLLAPDACAEETQGTSPDPCPEGCPRCLCCARVPAFVPQLSSALLVEPVTRADLLPPLDPSTTPSPRGIYHIPKQP